MDIYVPRGYESDTLPVLYLIHGINGHEGAWQERGSAVDTLQALIDAGRCAPMLLVMPDCNLWPTEERPLTRGSRWKCVWRYAELSHEHTLEYAVSDLMDMVDTVYHTSWCAVAGLSDGARISANIARVRPDRILAVGMFSPVVSCQQLPPDSLLAGCPDMPCIDYRVYVGRTDMFRPNGQRFHRRMERRQLPHSYTILPGRHDWPVWRVCLARFLEETAALKDRFTDRPLR